MIQPTAWVFRLALVVAVLGAPLAGAATYNEFLNGDLTNNGQAPTLWPLGTGGNVLVAQSGSTDVDIVHITVPPDHTFDSLIIEAHTSDIQVFAGLQAGSVWTAGSGLGVNLSHLLGWVSFPEDPNVAHEGQDILYDMSFSEGSSGFVAPLPSGDYTLMFQTNGALVQYALSFNILADGDFNRDTTVDNMDLTLWADSLGVFGSTEGDADRDGDSEGDDFLIWQYNYGMSGGVPIRAIPEPTLALWAAATLAAAATRRRWSTRRAGESW